MKFLTFSNKKIEELCSVAMAVLSWAGMYAENFVGGGGDF